MNPGDIKPGMLPPNMRSGNVPLIGAPKQLQVMVASLCVNCFPKAKPAVFIWFGNGLCQDCFVPVRKELDRDKKTGETVASGIEARDYKETWGKSPEEEEQEKLDGTCY